MYFYKKEFVIILPEILDPAVLAPELIGWVSFELSSVASAKDAYNLGSDGAKNDVTI